jgi:hypothetical protein
MPVLLYIDEMLWMFMSERWSPTVKNIGKKSSPGIRCDQNRFERAKRGGLITGRLSVTNFKIHLYSGVNCVMFSYEYRYPSICEGNSFHYNCS